MQMNSKGIGTPVKLAGHAVRSTVPDDAKAVEVGDVASTDRLHLRVVTQ